ncbi:uncharacterized protein LOC129588706 isoform X2 [Paramacrobiotus metropolitanus]|uniref:uncharacterized protein LOC129588706 isoform X2 n=1 Tax=Paramacrobiotus metropolitanus TaxID=2943436 RepID=UPI0024461B7D|nr:uncharacterized protein LOC129588706 isoform X2 [Paramacrobiotus metropolitanus]
MGEVMADGTELILSDDEDAPLTAPLITLDDAVIDDLLAASTTTPTPTAAPGVKQEMSLQEATPAAERQDSEEEFPGAYETGEILRRPGPAPLNGEEGEGRPAEESEDMDVTVSPTQLLAGIEDGLPDEPLPSTSGATDPDVEPPPAAAGESYDPDISMEQPSMEECSPIMTSSTNAVMNLTLDDLDVDEVAAQRRQSAADGDDDNDVEDDAASDKSYVTNEEDQTATASEVNEPEEGAGSAEHMENMLKSIGLESRQDDLNEGNERRAADDREHSLEIEAPPMRPAPTHSPAPSAASSVRSATPSTLSTLSAASGSQGRPPGFARRTGGVPPRPEAPKLSANSTAKAQLRRCIVSSCRHYNKPQHGVFPFPPLEGRAADRNRWMSAINNSAARNHAVSGAYLLHDNTAGVCREHFRETDVLPDGTLRRGSAPVRFDVRPGYEPPATGKSQFAKKSVGLPEPSTSRACTVAGCKSTKPGHVHMAPPALVAKPPGRTIKKTVPLSSVPVPVPVRSQSVAKKKGGIVRAPQRSSTRLAVQLSRRESEDGDYDADMDFPDELPVADDAEHVAQAPLKIVLQKAQPAPPPPPPPRRNVVAAVEEVFEEGDDEEDEEEDPVNPREPLKIILQKMVPVTQQRQNEQRGSTSKGPMMTRAVQVQDEELEADSDEEEVEAIIREAHEEIVDLRLKVEDAESALTTEKFKVAHLEARVAAWMREHFQCQAQETERIEMLDKLAQYYLARAKKVEEDKRAVAAEVELFRANYVRAQKETESYRAQIIELQTTSARQVELVVQTKTKNEKEAMETIASLRRQLAESVSANQTARKTYVNLLNKLGIPVPDEIAALADAGTVNRNATTTSPAKATPAKKATAAAKKKAAESAAAALTPPAKTAPPPTPVAAAPVTASQPVTPSASFNPRQTRQRQREQEAAAAQQQQQPPVMVQQPMAGYGVQPPHGGWNGYGQAQTSVIQQTPGGSAFSQPTYQAQPETSGRKRGRPRREDTEPAIPSPKKPRESSVDRAVRYLMSL